MLDMFPTTSVDMFPITIVVETVALLSKLNTEQHLDIEIGEYELSEIDFSKDATYGEIKKFVLDKYGLKVSSLYIAQVKRKYGLRERENYNISKKETHEKTTSAGKESPFWSSGIVN